MKYLHKLLCYFNKHETERKYFTILKGKYGSIEYPYDQCKHCGAIV